MAAPTKRAEFLLALFVHEGEGRSTVIAPSDISRTSRAIASTEYQQATDGLLGIIFCRALRDGPSPPLQQVPGQRQRFRSGRWRHYSKISSIFSGTKRISAALSG
jgi:hypothetical protein